MNIENIKFKAKSLNSGNWIEGDLIRQSNGIYIRRHKNLSVIVDASTVCQFTGLKDCKGNEIWEGDMIKSPYLGNVAIVEWDDSLCGFKCVDERRYINYSLRALVESSGWSLIGNKFDKKK